MMRFLKKLVKKAKTAYGKMKSRFDEEGSYTGTPNGEDRGAKPQQDADDL